MYLFFIWYSWTLKLIRKFCKKKHCPSSSRRVCSWVWSHPASLSQFYVLNDFFSAIWYAKYCSLLFSWSVLSFSLKYGHYFPRNSLRKTVPFSKMRKKMLRWIFTVAQRPIRICEDENWREPIRMGQDEFISWCWPWWCWCVGVHCMDFPDVSRIYLWIHRCPGLQRGVDNIV